MGNNIKHNIFLPLMTDILPYELPVLFTNKYFYKFLKSNYDEYYNNICTKFEENKNKNKKIHIYRNNILNINMFIKSYKKNDNIGLLLLQQYIDNDSIPMLFHIRKNNNSYRTMSIIHPASQINICDLYHKYENELLFYTNIGSDFSLRYPYKKEYKYIDVDIILKKYVNIDLESDSESDLINNNDYSDGEFQVRYFSYKKYLFINSFYNSPEYKDLEKKFDLCSMFDIKKCFDSIYTHSIAWAVKGIEAAKNNRNINCFENKIDKVMRACNWGETHGILIGSEFSRIFAEIILQKIDVEVVKKIENENTKLKKGIDYAIKRYVDNYFIFANNKDLLKKIRSIYNEKLEQYKLFTNNDKDVLLQRPFITNLSSIKIKINIFFKDILNFNLKNIIDEKKYNEILEKSNKNLKYCLDNLRILINENNIITYDISSFINRKLKRYIECLLQSINNKKNKYLKEIIQNLQLHLDYILDIASYMYNIGAKYSSTITICKIYYLIMLIAKKIKMPEHYYSKIYTHILIFYEKNYREDFLFEYIELFHILNILSKKYPLPCIFLYDLIKIHKNDITYIELMILLLYIKDRKKYKKIKNIILEIIKTKYKESSTLMKSSELFMMFFDIIKCPYIDNSYKKEIIDIVNIPILLDQNGIHMEYDEIIKNIQSSFYFFEWPNDKINSTGMVLENNYPIKQLYLKKELHFSS